MPTLTLAGAMARPSDAAIVYVVTVTSDSADGSQVSLRVFDDNGVVVLSDPSAEDGLQFEVEGVDTEPPADTSGIAKRRSVGGNSSNLPAATLFMLKTLCPITPHSVHTLDWLKTFGVTIPQQVGGSTFASSTDSSDGRPTQRGSDAWS